jgi:hypothetical protein
MATNGLLNFQGTNKATFVGATSNIALDVVNSSLGIGITGTDPPSSNLYITGNAYVTSDISVGGVLNMGVVNVAARHTLEAITSLGASTPSTLTLTNTGTSLVASGDVTVDTNTFHVDTTNNRVGVGTVTPQRLLHLKRSGAATFQRIQNVNNNNGCGIELMRGDSDTWGATSWSDWRISNTEHLDFGVKFTGTDITSVLHLNVNGNVGAGTTEPLTKLQVQHSGGGDTVSTTTALVSIIENQVPNYGKYGLFMGVSQSSGQPWLQGLRYAGTTLQNNDKFHIQLNPLGGIIIVNGTNYSSDDRIKSNEQYIENATETLLKLKPQTYDKRSMMNTGEWKMRESGLIAQDVWYDTPELRHLVSHDKNADIPIEKPFVDDDPTKDPDYSSWGEIATLNYQGLIAYLIKSNQEIHTELQAEKEKTRALEDKVEALEDHLTRFTVQVTARLAALESQK